MVPIIEMSGIAKRFPGVVALEDVSLSLQPAEVLGLIGENGAGKSTLMRILGGIHAPDAGTISIDGASVQVEGVRDAMRMGIAFIHQELNVLDNLDVAGNVFLGREPLTGPLRLVDRRRMGRETEPHLRRIGLDVSPATPLADLSIAQQQLVEIAKALSMNARVLIMDEPTSSLTLSETERLLALVRDLKREGVSVIYISHRLSELKAIADRVVALRDGHNAGELRREEIEHDAMVRMMVGRDIRSFYVEHGGERRAAFLSVRGIRSRAFPLRPVSFDAAAGEILGIAGLVGAGRSEMAEALFGVDGNPGGEVRIGGEPVRISCCRDAIAVGIYLATEDRRRTGLVTAMTIRENVTLPAVRRHARAGLISRPSESAAANRQREELNIRAPSVETPVVNLSGGNQQKVVLAKWLGIEPRVMIFDEPTRGIDVGAKAEIYRLMRALALKGVAVLMISSDMEEVLNVSDRVAVMHEGRISGILDRDACTEENIMHLAVGARVDAARPPVEA